MITRFRVRNYKALRDITLDLTPIHVLIGPNDSGKTSILEALATLCRSVDYPLPQAFVGSWQGADLVWKGDIEQLVGFEAKVGIGKKTCTYRFACQFLPQVRDVRIANEALTFDPLSEPVVFRERSAPATIINRIVKGNQHASDEERHAAQELYNALSGVHLYRWVPRLLSLPVAPHSQGRFRMESTGFGLALCLDDMLGYDRRRFDDLENRFKQIFPEVNSIMLMREPAFTGPVDDPEQIPMLQKRADGKGLHFRYNGNGQELSASQVSDGMLLVLAYLTVLYLPQPPRVLLIEEPENGIHPRRLQDVLQILRELITEQGYTQIILTTHSPYVVDQFQPEEVSLCHKEEDGSVLAHRLSESQTVREQIDLFTLGEIWTAEGDDVLAKTTQRRAEASE